MSVLKLKTMKTKTKKLFLVSAAILLSALAFYPKYVRAEGIMLTEPLPGQTGALTKVSGLADYLVKIYNLGLILAGVLAMGGIMIGGFLYMTASYSGNLGKTANGKDVISSSLLGLGVALLSYLLIYTIDPRLTRPQDVFMDIGKGTCSGGIPNVENEETCKGYCTVGNGEEKYQVFTPQYDTNKCCKCLPKEQSPQYEISCAGSYDHTGVPLSKCQDICDLSCESGRKCRSTSQSADNCCKCEVITELIDSGSAAPPPIQSEASPSNESECKDTCAKFCSERGFALDNNGTKIDPATGTCSCACF